MRRQVLARSAGPSIGCCSEELGAPGRLASCLSSFMLSHVAQTHSSTMIMSRLNLCSADDLYHNFADQKEAIQSYFVSLPGGEGMCCYFRGKWRLKCWKIVIIHFYQVCLDVWNFLRYFDPSAAISMWTLLTWTRLISVLAVNTVPSCFSSKAFE